MGKVDLYQDLSSSEPAFLGVTEQKGLMGSHTNLGSKPSFATFYCVTLSTLLSLSPTENVCMCGAASLVCRLFPYRPEDVA